MSAEQKTKNSDLPEPMHHRLLTRTEVGAMVGVILVSLGIVFFLAESDQLSYSSPWWTLFIGIPGLTFVVAGGLTVRQERHVTGLAWSQFIIGTVLILLAGSFLLDPQWSFTRGWTLFNGDYWNTIWKWGLLIAGVVIAGVGIWQRNRGSVVLGIVLATVGAVFVLNIDWGRVWPLFIVGAGILVLIGLITRRR